MIEVAFLEKQKTSFYHYSLQTDTFNVHIFLLLSLWILFKKNFHAIVIVTFSFK